LKCVLVRAGNLKCERFLRDINYCDELEYIRISDATPEQEIVIQSIHETIVLKLIADDIPLLDNVGQSITVQYNSYSYS